MHVLLAAMISFRERPARIRRWTVAPPEQLLWGPAALPPVVRSA